MFRLKWFLEIKEVQEQAFFIDEAFVAPFPFKKWRHTHTFVQKKEHTLMIDEIEFEAYLPVSIIRLLLYGMFRDRGKVMKRYFK